MAKQNINQQLRESKAELRLITDELKSKQRLIEFYETVQKRPSEVITIPHKIHSNPKLEQGTVIAGLSDIHGEQRITKAQTNGFNWLTPHRTEERLCRYADNLVKLTKIFRKDIQLETLIWAWLGDMIHGFIHEEYLRTNYYTPIEAALWMTDILDKIIEFIIYHSDFKDIYIICKIGNHSRTTTKVYTDDEAKHSYEWGIYHTLQKKYPQLHWVIDESYLTYTKVYDKILRLHHGHAFRYMGGIGGIHIPLMRYIAKLNRQRRADMDIIGHWHSRNFSATDGYIVNSCVCGVSPYSIRLGFPIEPPTQFFQILDKKRGFTINAPIMLEN